jgi:O-acetylserine/cysteine efflux transporter
MTVWSGMFAPIPLFALSLVIDGPGPVGHALTHLTLANVLSTGYTAYLASLVGYGIWNTLLARHPAALVVPFTLLVPVAGMLSAWLFLGERPGQAEAIGGLVLLAGVAITAIGRRPARSGDLRPEVELPPGVAPASRGN